MKTRAAILWGRNQPWQVEEIDLHPPKAHEVLVKIAAAGMCHSDEHLVTGDLIPAVDPGQPDRYPIIGGHEGAGVVVEVGPDVTSLAPGDHVSASFIPSCGRCRYCSTGRQRLCDLGGAAFKKGQISDGTSRHFFKGTELNLFAKLGTFSEYTVAAEASLIRVEPDIRLELVALVSCGVATGWGSAVKRAGTEPGDTVVVVGIGGVGISAVQGARIAGASRIIAVDPVEFKREKAMELGATHTFASMEEAIPAVNELTWGTMAERVILTPGVLRGEMLEGANQLCGKGGTIVVTAVSPIGDVGASINLFELGMWEKEIKGTIFGSLNPRADIPRLLDLYRNGQLKLDELITRRYTLDEVNQGYQDMRDGLNIRGVITFE